MRAIEFFNYDMSESEIRESDRVSNLLTAFMKDNEPSFFDYSRFGRSGQDGTIITIYMEGRGYACKVVEDRGTLYLGPSTNIDEPRTKYDQVKICENLTDYLIRLANYLGIYNCTKETFEKYYEYYK